MGELEIYLHEKLDIPDDRDVQEYLDEHGINYENFMKFLGETIARKAGATA